MTLNLDFKLTFFKVDQNGYCFYVELIFPRLKSIFPRLKSIFPRLKSIFFKIKVDFSQH